MTSLLNKCHLGCVLDVLPRLAAEGLQAQTCVTSPPYWGLRDYGVPPSRWPEIEFVPMAGLPPVVVPAWDGCLGLEPDPLMFTAHLVHVFRLVWDVLADDGTCWVNLGDSYAGSRSGQGMTPSRRRDDAPIPRSDVRVAGLKPKDLVGQPWRVAFALQADGWYLRRDVIWHKVNAMPESVTDRPTSANEVVFLLAKEPQYYYDADAIKEVAVSDAPSGNGFVGRQGGARDLPMSGGRGTAARWELSETRNRRSVWAVPLSPFPGSHFATFPPALIEPCILAGSRPADVVLDPFGGSGTTAMVAERLGRQWVTVEIKPEYRDMHERRAVGLVGLPL